MPGTTTGSMSGRLRELLAQGPLMAPDCASALMGRIIEYAGFSAGYMGGHATGMLHYAIPDVGVLTTTEMIDQAARVVEAISIPLIVDADQCGESIADVHRTVRRLENVGVAGLHMEDEVTPKHSMFAGGLMPMTDMQERIAVAAAARQHGVVIIARCDELHVNNGGGGGSIDEAIRRGIAYAEAGADLYLPTFATEEQTAAIAAEVPIPLACYGRLMPAIQLCLATGWGTAALAREHLRWAQVLRATGELPEEAFEFPAKDDLITQADYDAVVDGWVRRTGRPHRDG